MALNPPLSVPSLDVTGRVFLITGGTQGLGLSIARLLKVKGAAGLVLVSRSKDKGLKACEELSSVGCLCEWIDADMANVEDCSSLITKAAKAMMKIGPISGVVNSAATTERGNLFTTTAASFDSQMAVNVRAPFLITQAAAQHMIASGVKGGSIVNICSVAAHGGAPFIMAYSTAKAALVALTKNNAAELAPKGIRVNAINMGWCLTENEDRLQTLQTDSKWIDRADNSTPIGRILRPEDAAVTVGFLLSRASIMTTGTIVELHPEAALGMISLLATDDR